METKEYKCDCYEVHENVGGIDGCGCECHQIADHIKRNNIVGHSINVDGFCNMGCC